MHSREWLFQQSGKESARFSGLKASPVQETFSPCSTFNMPEGIYSLSHVFEGKRPGISIIPGGNAPSDKYRGAAWHVFHCSCPQKAGSNGNGVGISSPHAAVTRPEA
ncbi:hypothetical protein EAJ17_06555 [Akkermansia sp. aa_0143]|jgi:hypothetical protein|nr:hypothetical protein EAJ17_06555 [Akkermansia sp. aa_0143]